MPVCARVSRTCVSQLSGAGQSIKDTGGSRDTRNYQYMLEISTIEINIAYVGKLATLR